MKKNITINLFGSLYAIDEDAYELLRNYLDNMRSYFSNKEDGNEIATDIESRVGELLSELKAGGVEAISIEHIENIIGRIGNPDQLEPENEASAANGNGAAETADTTESTGKKSRATPLPRQGRPHDSRHTVGLMQIFRRHRPAAVAHIDHHSLLRQRHYPLNHLSDTVGHHSTGRDGSRTSADARPAHQHPDTQRRDHTRREPHRRICQ